MKALSREAFTAAITENPIVNWAGSDHEYYEHLASVLWKLVEDSTIEEWGTKTGTGALRTDIESIARSIADQHPYWSLVRRRVTGWERVDG